MMKVYISMPISGHSKEDVTRRSDEAKRTLREMGHDPVSPIDDVLSWDEEWIDYMIKDLTTLKYCQGIIFLKGWEKSPGCRIERIVAERTGLKIIEI